VNIRVERFVFIDKIYLYKENQNNKKSRGFLDFLLKNMAFLGLLSGVLDNP
jgi:hypothetical protein